ncbi:MAG: rod shape-determining protein MreD [Candidatus Omnitrophica bacterium]|nr:rod shape-determining protein MreD [Candidatus Omnitrophota bacterium]
MSALIIAIFTIVCFIIEAVWVDVLGVLFKPNLLIILIIFFNLFRGIRYGLITALFAGLLADSFSVKPFGINIFSFVICAYMATVIKMYVYQVGSVVSRVLMVFFVTLINILVLYFLNVMISPIAFSEAFMCVLIPQTVMTVLIAPYAFEKFKQCALKLFA